MTKRIAGLVGIQTNPELAKLLDAARQRPRMTAAEIRAQAISFVWGNLALDGSTVTKEQVAAAYDRMAGKPLTI